MSRISQKISQSDARYIATAFAQEHGQDSPAVIKLALSWLASAMLDSDWAEHATEPALRRRLAKAFLVQPS